MVFRAKKRAKMQRISSLTKVNEYFCFVSIWYQMRITMEARIRATDWKQTKKWTVMNTMDEWILIMAHLNCCSFLVCRTAPHRTPLNITKGCDAKWNQFSYSKSNKFEIRFSIGIEYDSRKNLSIFSLICSSASVDLMLWHSEYLYDTNHQPLDFDWVDNQLHANIRWIIHYSECLKDSLYCYSRHSLEFRIGFVIWLVLLSEM